MASQKTPPPTALDVLDQSTLSKNTVQSAGAGKAYQSVAQSSAIVVQDAADNLRNIMTISTTSIGVAMAKFLSTKEPVYLTAIQKAQQLVDTAAAQFKTVGQDAADVLKNFPSS